MTVLRLVLTLAALSCLLPTDAFGQAYCALRDPTRRVYQAYPAAKSYRSIVRSVDENVRQEVARLLPFTIHFNELGRHTVYVPVEGQRPLGLVHARSEKGRWGLVEIVWALRPSMHVEGYSFQRCRSRSKTAVETDTFKRQLVGKGFSELRAMLTEDGASLRPGALLVKPGAEDLAATLVRSALKTIAVTRLAWARDLQVIRPLYNVHAAFPETAQVELVGNPYTQPVMNELESRFGAETSSPVQREAVVLYRARNSDGQTIGHVIRTPWASLDSSATLWWSVKPGQSITGVLPEEEWPDRETAEAFRQVKGLGVDRLDKCATAAELTGAEILLVSRRN